MARIVLLIAVVCLMMSAIPNVAAARECGIQCFGMQCDGQCFVLNWSYKDDCGTPTFTIERQCFPADYDDPWVVVEDDFQGTTYKDCPAAACISDQYRYKLTINCTPPCYCTGPMCSVMTNWTDCD
jgi:hypothetical protein